MTEIPISGRSSRRNDSNTLGDMARRRREILLQLEEEGVLTLNKELEIPVLPQRIAVVSSATAAGQIGSSSTATNDDYYVKFIDAGINTIQSCQHRFLHLISLH